MIRLFIAIDTPREIMPRLAGIRDRLATTHADVKWERDDKLHCTLKFLGDAREEILPAIAATLRQVASSMPTFPVRYAGLGCFPDKREPRIIWAGMEDPDGTLRQLAQTVETRMAALGFKPEQRVYHPHVTLGRVKDSRHLRELLATMETVTFDCSPVSVREIALVRSELKPGGSVYTPVEKVALSHSLEP
jgi:RNA 2',3'-cyclic 3'-phosphodiesterase